MPNTPASPPQTFRVQTRLVVGTRYEVVIVKSGELLGSTYVSKAAANREIKALLSEGWVQESP